MFPDLSVQPIEYQGHVYDFRHGSAFDCGSADSYYSRPRRPHMYVANSIYAEISAELMSDDDIAAYYAGYDMNEQSGDKKDLPW
jgi:hypothetical protein